ncbi:MAG: hypothetical protein WCT77_00290 [Bacteroidota bacterium]
MATKYKVFKEVTIYQVNVRNKIPYKLKVGDIIESEMRSNDGGKSYSKTPTTIIDGKEYGTMFVEKFATPIDVEEKTTEIPPLKPQTTANKLLTHGIIIGGGSLAGLAVHNLMKSKSWGLGILIPLGIITTYSIAIFADYKAWNKK